MSLATESRVEHRSAVPLRPASLAAHAMPIPMHDIQPPFRVALSILQSREVIGAAPQIHTVTRRSHEAARIGSVHREVYHQPDRTARRRTTRIFIGHVILRLFARRCVSRSSIFDRINSPLDIQINVEIRRLTRPVWTCLVSFGYTDRAAIKEIGRVGSGNGSA
jgi:hypothetical protein